MAQRTTSLHIRLTERERRKAERVADRLGCSTGAVFRQGMNDLYARLFPNDLERETRKDSGNK